MLIGELVKKTKLSRDTIRYYEKMGLLKVGRGASEFNNYKDYSTDSVERLEIIKWAKDLGFTLREIGEALSLWEENLLSVEDKRRIVKQKLASIEQKMDDLIKMKKLLTEMYEDISPDCL